MPCLEQNEGAKLALDIASMLAWRLALWCYEGLIYFKQKSCMVYSIMTGQALRPALDIASASSLVEMLHIRKNRSRDCRILEDIRYFV